MLLLLLLLCLGNTMVFGKDVMAEKLLFWHMSLVSNTIRTWARFATPVELLSIFKEAVRQLSSRWRTRYLEKKVAAIMPSVLQMQQLAKCAIAKKELLRRRVRLAMDGAAGRRVVVVVGRSVGWLSLLRRGRKSDRRALAVPFCFRLFRRPCTILPRASRHSSVSVTQRQSGHG